MRTAIETGKPLPAEQAKTQSSSATSNDDAMTFVGKNYEYFKRKWDIAEQKNSKQSWNWASFLGSYAWLAYRKMYVHSGIVIGILILETIVEVVIGGSRISSTINFFNIGLFIGVGFSGNSWYKKHVEKSVREVRSKCLPDQVAIELAKAGGTSMGAAIGATVGLLAVFAVMAAITS